MEGLPHLSAIDLRADIEEAYRARRHHHLFAFFGTGDEQTIALTDGEVRVIPVRSEIELREKMPALQDDDNVRVAFLVPWSHDIPLDIAGRFALNGRVRKIGKEARLRALFGVNEIDDDVRRVPLVEYLLRPAHSRRYPLGEGRLTVDGLWASWLRVDWDLDTQGGVALDALLAFATHSPRGPEFVAAMSEPAAGKTREALLTWLERAVGPAGPAVWRCWEEGRGRRAVELALVFEPLAKSPLGGVRMWVKTKVREQLKVDKDADLHPVAEALGREAAGALRILDRKLPVTELRALARAADDVVVDTEVRAALVDSQRLPSAWANRLDALGRSLSLGLHALTPDAAAAAERTLRALETHVFFKDEDQRPTLKRAEMAVRLLCWLVARPDRKAEPGNTPYGDAEALGRWYALEGGYADRARRWARGNDAGEFGKGVQEVVAAADEARALLDRRFARSLAAWISAAQPATQVTPIHEAAKRIAVRFLEGNDDRRLLVLLLDGMAWAQATELLESLGNRAAPWGPLAWHAAKDTRIGESALPVVFAALPTVTEVSRSSFFAGKVFGPGAKLTTPDPAHWQSHAAVKKHVPPTEVPRLLLRGEGHTLAGGASSEALSLVADTNKRIVAIVLNAIDDSLKASHAVRHPWGVENIASLPDLLDKARESGRAVLLASDHGHVPADRIKRVATATPAQGARWRPWPSASAPVQDFEVGFSGSRVYTPPGAHGVVLLADDTGAYIGSTHVGEHGGATLAEVVAPCLLIGCADTTGAALDDLGQRVQATPIPRWWHFETKDVAGSVEETPPASGRKPPKKSPHEALALPLPGIAPPPPPVEPKPAAAPAASSAFAASVVLKARAPAAQSRQEVVEAVEVLLQRQGVMAGEAFAGAMRILPFRVSGFISKLQEVLNLDGYDVLRYDPVTRQVHLDRGKLAQLFEVPL